MNSVIKISVGLLLAATLHIGGLSASAQSIAGLKGEFTSFSEFGHHPYGGAATVGWQLKMILVQMDMGYDRYSPMMQEGQTAGRGVIQRMHMDLSIMPRIYGNRSHSINAYLGAGVTGGVRFEDPAEGEPEGSAKSCFLPGVFPEVQGEFFVARRTALFVDVRVPYYFMEEAENPEVRYALGVRWMF